MKIEPAEWKPISNHSSKGYAAALRRLGVGDVVRIQHDDVRCGVGVRPAHDCPLQINLSPFAKRTGMKFESYHEAQYVLIVRRIA